MPSTEQPGDHDRLPDRAGAAFWDGWLHEARTGLQVVLGRAQWLQRHADRRPHLPPSEVRPTLQAIEAAAHRLRTAPVPAGQPSAGRHVPAPLAIAGERAGDL